MHKINKKRAQKPILRRNTTPKKTLGIPEHLKNRLTVDDLKAKVEYKAEVISHKLKENKIEIVFSVCVGKQKVRLPQSFNLELDGPYRYYEIMMSVLADGDVDEDCTGKWCIIKVSKRDGFTNVRVIDLISAEEEDDFDEEEDDSDGEEDFVDDEEDEEWEEDE